MAALYVISFPNGKNYVGMTQKPTRRLAQHKSSAKKGSHLAVHRAIAKYDGEFRFNVVCIGETKYIAELEVKAIAAYRALDRDFGYNVAVGGDSGNMLGRENSPEARLKISTKNKGRKRTPEQAIAGGLARTGLKRSDETKRKISEALSGKPKSLIHKEKLRIARTGLKWSQAERDSRISARLLRNKIIQGELYESI